MRSPARSPARSPPRSFDTLLQPCEGIARVTGVVALRILLDELSPHTLRAIGHRHRDVRAAEEPQRVDVVADAAVALEEAAQPEHGRHRLPAIPVVARDVPLVIGEPL